MVIFTYLFLSVILHRQISEKPWKFEDYFFNYSCPDPACTGPSFIKLFYDVNPLKLTTTHSTYKAKLFTSGFVLALVDITLLKLGFAWSFASALFLIIFLNFTEAFYFMIGFLIAAAVLS